MSFHIFLMVLKDITQTEHLVLLLIQFELRQLTVKCLLLSFLKIRFFTIHRRLMFLEDSKLLANYDYN